MKPWSYYSTLGLGYLLALISACSVVGMFVCMFTGSAMPGTNNTLFQLGCSCLVLAACSGFAAWLITDHTTNKGLDYTVAKKEVRAEQERRLELVRAQHDNDLLRLKNEGAALQTALEHRLGIEVKS